MATGDHEPESPVRIFCAELADYVTRSGHTRKYVAAQHPMSDSQVFAVLRGEVRNPPSFDRMVTPVIVICGGDEEAVAQWRARHAVMEREHTVFQRRRTRPSQDAAPLAAGDPGPAGTSRRRAVTIVALTCAVLAAPVTWFLSRPDDRATPPPPPAAACMAGPPAPNEDLLDGPLPSGTGAKKFEYWYGNDPRAVVRDFDRHRWSATVRDSTSAKPWDVLAIRGCLPIVAGDTYRLSFRARVSADTTINVRVQNDVAPEFEPSLHEEVALTTEMQDFSWPLTGTVTSRTSELTFQLGANPGYDIEVTDVRLILVDD